MQLRFFYCRHCGKIIAMVKEPGTPTMCCGDPMMRLFPGTNVEQAETHIPVIKVSGNTVSVTVGSKLHPTTMDHYIEWILLQTDKGLQEKWLSPGNAPGVDFAIMTGEKVEAAYEYCNIHGMWKTEYSASRNQNLPVR